MLPASPLGLSLPSTSVELSRLRPGRAPDWRLSHHPSLRLSRRRRRGAVRCGAVRSPPRPLTAACTLDDTMAHRVQTPPSRFTRSSHVHRPRVEHRAGRTSAPARAALTPQSDLRDPLIARTGPATSSLTDCRPEDRSPSSPQRRYQSEDRAARATFPPGYRCRATSRRHLTSGV